MNKKIFDFSKGIFHKNIAHFYVMLAFLYLIIGVIILLFGTRIAADLSLSGISILLLPPIITSILAGTAVFKDKKTQFQIYAYSTIGYSIIPIFACNFFGRLMEQASATLTLPFQNEFSAFSFPVANPLPGVKFALTLVVIMIILAMVLMVIALYLYLANIKPKEVVKVEENPTVEEKSTSVELVEDVNAENIVEENIVEENNVETE